VQQLVKQYEALIERGPNLDRRLHVPEVVEVDSHSPHVDSRTIRVLKNHLLVHLAEVDVIGPGAVLDDKRDVRAQNSEEYLPGGLCAAHDLRRIAEAELSVSGEVKITKAGDARQARDQPLLIPARKRVGRSALTPYSRPGPKGIQGQRAAFIHHNNAYEKKQ
jgi:hypothetical protein